MFIEGLKVIFSLNSKEPVNSKEKTIIIKGIPVVYFREGKKGTPLILLHGWGQSKETWIKVMKKLGKTHPTYALDMQGFGKTPLGNNIFDLEDYSDILEEFINKNKIKKAIFLGHSFGGKIAVQFALTHKRKIAKLIIYSSNILAKKGFFEIVTSFGIGILDSRFLAVPIRIYLYFRTKSYKRFKILLEIYKKQKGKNFNKQIKKIAAKTLLLYGKYDLICPTSCGKELNRLIPKSKLIIFEKSSHLAHIEEREKFIKELIDFIDT